jgi:hypothetical protein
MFVVRFVALIALAIWVGGMVTSLWLTTGGSADPDRQMRILGYTCGGVVLVSLFVMKFVGPPPQRFPLRAGTVALMLFVVLYAHVMNVVSVAPTAINIVLGLMLLAWYGRE